MGTIRAVHMNLSAFIYVHSMFQLLYVLKFDVMQRPYVDTIRVICVNLSALIYVHSIFQLVYDVREGIVFVFLIKSKDYFIKSSLESREHVMVKYLA